MDAVGDALTNCKIYLELYNAYWPDVDLGDADDDYEVYDCEVCGGEIADEYMTCTCQ